MISLSEAMRTVYCHYSTGLSSAICPAFSHLPAQFLRANLYQFMVSMSRMDKTRSDLHSETTNSHAASGTLVL